MSGLRTRPTDQSVTGFLNEIGDEQRKRDCFRLVDLMQKITGAPPVMWGSSIIGFGSYHYTYASGREGDWMLTGFSPRKQNLTIYIMSGFDPFETDLKKLGRYKTGASCLYIKSLEEVDEGVLERLIRASVQFLKSQYS
mgnify:CR=1 FL=1